MYNYIRNKKGKINMTIKGYNKKAFQNMNQRIINKDNKIEMMIYLVLYTLTK